MLPTSIAYLVQRGMWDEAAKCLLPILESNAEAYACRGYCLLQIGSIEEGAESLRRAIALGHEAFDTYTNLVRALDQSGKYREAVQVAWTTVRLFPRHAEAHALFAQICERTGNLPKALDAWNQASRLAPSSLELMLGQLRVLAACGNDDEVEKLAQRLISAYEYRQHPLLLAYLVDIRQRRSEWKLLASLQKKFLVAIQAASVQVHASLLQHCSDDPRLVHRLASRAGSRAPSVTAGPKKQRDSRLTIAYMSADIREHPVAYMLGEVLSHHRSDHVRIILVLLAPADTSAIATRLLHGSERVLHGEVMTDEELSQAIWDAGIDVLIDVMGMTLGNRIGVLDRRSAPVQLLWLGTTATTGHTCYDGFVVDDELAPIGYEVHTSEPLIRLSHCYHPIGVGPGEGPAELTRSDLGFPLAPAILVGMPQAPERVQPDYIEQVARCLAKHPRTHLVLRGRRESRQAMLLALESWGIPRERIIFLDRLPDRSAYLAAIRHLDVYLDTVPHGGHSTVGEALSLGVPVLAVEGRCLHARVATSMLHTLGLPNFVCSSVDQQIEVLHQWLSDDNLRISEAERVKKLSPSIFCEHHRRLAHSLEETAMSFFTSDD